ncbi:MAG TPA: FIST N-terminal domain-containing protein [Kofleriaceae bacterium]|jgi:hypothetical protein
MDLAELGYRDGSWSGPFPPLDSPDTLVLAFAAPSFGARGDVLSALAAAYPRSVVVGCSTAGEIHQARILDESIAVTVIRFAGTRVRCAQATIAAAEDSFGAGSALAEELAGEGLRAVLVLSEGITVNGSALVRGLNARLPAHVAVSGGLAGDGPRFGHTWVLAGGRAASHTAVAVGLYGDALRITHGSQGGWDPFGPAREVTSSRDNVVFTLDGRPALSLYRKYLGDRAAELPSSALLFPLGVGDSLDAPHRVVRTVLGVDEAAQSMTFAGDVPAGHFVKFMRASSDRLVLGARGAGQAARDHHAGPVLALAVSCVGRRVVLGERTEEELDAVQEILPPGAIQVGFYSYGELSPHDGRCELHNQTMTLTLISEVP